MQRDQVSYGWNHGYVSEAIRQTGICICHRLPKFAMEPVNVKKSLE